MSGCRTLFTTVLHSSLPAFGVTLVPSVLYVFYFQIFHFFQTQLLLFLLAMLCLSPFHYTPKPHPIPESFGFCLSLSSHPHCPIHTHHGRPQKHPQGWDPGDSTSPSSVIKATAGKMATGFPSDHFQCISS